MVIQLTDEAVHAGAWLCKACQVLGINIRTLRRWRSAEDLTDRRKGAAKHRPHALSEEEKQRIVTVCNEAQYASLPSSQIVPHLADEGAYIASESSFYRVLRQHKQLHRQDRAPQPPRKHYKPMPVAATGSNQARSWDITYLPTTIGGQFLRLYMALDIYSRKNNGWEVHHDELASHAATLIEKASLRHHVRPEQLILHTDNGSPIKGATILATLQRNWLCHASATPCRRRHGHIGPSSVGVRACQGDLSVTLEKPSGA